MTQTNEKTEWTKGPWLSMGRSRYHGDAFEISAFESPFWIAHVREEADANLIASAPDLFAALARMMEQPTENPLRMTVEQRAELWHAHEEARAALSKARGEP